MTRLHIHPYSPHPHLVTARHSAEAGHKDRHRTRRAKNGATFIFRADIPDGMDPDEARRRCEEAIRALAEGAGR